MLEISFDNFKPLQHDNLRSKSNFGNRMKLHIEIVIECGKPHRMIHDKIIYDQSIIRDLGDPIAL